MPRVATGGEDVGRFLDELEDRLHGLGVRTGLAWWGKYTGSLAEDLNELERQRSLLLLDPAVRRVVDRWTGRTADQALERRLHVLNDALLEAQVNSVPETYTLRHEIMDQVVRFRPVVFGRPVSNAERTRILQREPDRALRREAWMSVAPLSMEAGPRTAELIRRRNELARRAGFETYVDLALAAADLSRGEVTSILAALEAASVEPYREVLLAAAEAEGLEEIEPWDAGYLIEKAAAVPVEPFPRDRIVPALEDLVRGFGRDPAELGIKIVYHDIPFGGLCMAIDPPRDVRILANPQDGLNYFALLFHEYGHALHAVFAGRNSYLLQDEAGPFSEGMAEVLSWFVYDAGWLAGLGLEADLVEKCRRAQAARLALRHRTLSANAAWEFEAYADPDQDLTILLAATESRYLLTRPRPVHRWAGGPFPSGYPVYWQNYVLADLVAAATHQALRRRHGNDVLGSPEAFAALAETYWEPGGSRPWREKLQRFTGRDLDPAALDYRAPAPGGKRQGSDGR